MSLGIQPRTHHRLRFTGRLVVWAAGTSFNFDLQKRASPLASTYSAQHPSDQIIIELSNFFSVSARKVDWMAKPGDEFVDGNGPGLLQSIVIGREYREMIRLTSPPDLIQRLLFAIVAPIGELLGYKASFPENSDIED
jgi:hypothetical protein